MSLLTELNTVLSPLIPIETGVFSDTAPDCYMVITPVVVTFELYAADKPHHEVQEARLSLLDKGSYTAFKSIIVRVLLAADITIPYDDMHVGGGHFNGMYQPAVLIYADVCPVAQIPCIHLLYD